jgi:hypothetical protein
VTAAFASPHLVGLRRPAPHFQRAINLKYDLNNAAVIAAYVPTTRATSAIARLLRSLASDSRQRAFLLHGPYGSGKSLLATVLAAILSRDVPPETIAPLLSRLEETAPETAEFVQQQLSSGPRLLPVVLNGDEGDLASALLRALFTALQRIGWQEIRLATHYRAALETLDLWQTRYPETYARLGETLRQEGWSVERLTAGLKRADEQAYDIFQRLYPTLTAGATFNHYGHSVIETYQEAIRALAEEGRYSGILILWDEFGRFLEARASAAFGREAALLQELAEFANHSRETPLYLVLITHKVIGGYIWNLPPEYVQEWRRIGERFLSLDVSSDPLVTYRLIAAALTTPDEETWAQYLETRRQDLAQMLGKALEYRLFPELDEVQVRRWVTEGAYPLHPLTVYCLPRLSNKVAQNERTLFTFLTADDPLALSDLLDRMASDWQRRLDRSGGALRLLCRRHACRHWPGRGPFHMGRRRARTPENPGRRRSSPPPGQVPGSASDHRRASHNGHPGFCPSDRHRARGAGRPYAAAAQSPAVLPPGPYLGTEAGQ